MSSDKKFLIDLCSTEQIIILIRIFWSFNSSAAAVSFPSSSFFKSYQKVLVAFSYLMNIFFIFFKLLFSDNWSNLNWNSGTAEYLLSPIKSQPLILGEACALWFHSAWHWWSFLTMSFLISHYQNNFPVFFQSFFWKKLF